MTGVEAFLLVVIVFLIACGYLLHRHAEQTEARAQALRASWQHTLRELDAAREDADHYRADAEAARFEKAVLAEELAAERRGALILRTGLLEAQAQVDAMESATVLPTLRGRS